MTAADLMLSLAVVVTWLVGMSVGISIGRQIERKRWHHYITNIQTFFSK